MIKKLQKLLSRLKMRQIITLLCVQACAFTFLLGVYSYVKSNSMLTGTEYIYSYQEYTHIIGQITNGFLQIKANLLSTAVSCDEKSLSKIDTFNKQVRDNIDLYNSTEYEEEYEELLVQDIESTYIEFYSVVEKAVSQLQNGRTLDQQLLGRLNELESTLTSYLTELDDYVNGYASSDMRDLRISFRKTILSNVLFFTFCIVIFGSLGFLTVYIFNKEVREINDALKRTAEGDLTFHLAISEHNTEFNQMKLHLQQTISNFAKIMQELKDNSTTVEGQANDLRSNAVALSDSIANITESIQMVRSATEEQAVDIDSTVQVLDQFSTDLRLFNEDIELLSTNSMDVAEIANASTIKMDELSLSMQEVNTLIISFLKKFELLSDAVDEISTITSFINTIAAQTNLLALNASIESARVGEAGRGFAVVASEIGQLAEQSKEASNTISNLIKQIASETQAIQTDGSNVKEKLMHSTTTIEESLSSFKPMFSLLDEMITKIFALSSSSEKITEEKDQIYEKMTQTSYIANEISASTDNIAKPLSDITNVSLKVSDTSSHLYDLTNHLNDCMQQFKTLEEGQP